MSRRSLTWLQLALIGASVFFLCLLASFFSPSEAYPPAQDGTPTPRLHLPLVLKNYPPPATVSVVSSSTYTDTIPFPYLYVVGELINNTSGNVSSVRVTCALRNVSGAVIRMEYNYAMIGVLAPGQKAPFMVLFYDYPDYASYDITVTYSSTSQPARTGVSVLSSDSWTDPLSSWLYTVGEVQNNITSNISFIKVVVTYYDASGRVTNADYNYVALDILGPSQKGPFKVSTFNRPYSNYAFSVEYQPTSDPPATNVPVLSSSTWASGEWLNIVGEVQNNTGSNIQYVKVIATFYDSLGRVKNVDWNYAMLQVLGPGQKAPFKIFDFARPYDSCTFSVDYDTTTNTPPTGVPVLSSNSWTDVWGLNTTGEVQNNNAGNVRDVKVAVTYYDSVGNVANADSAYVPVTIIGAGQKACFRVSTENRPYNSYNLGNYSAILQ